jgi:hypothetical protein
VESLESLSQTYQAYLEQHRSASARLDEEPWDSELESLVSDLDHCVRESFLQLYNEWHLLHSSA